MSSEISTIEESIKIALDAAASEFCVDGKYNLNCKNCLLTTEQMNDMWQDLSGRYPIVSIEDPLHEDDWDGFKGLTSAIGSVVQVVGDDHGQQLGERACECSSSSKTQSNGCLDGD